MKKFLIFVLMISTGIQAKINPTQRQQKSAKEKMKAFLGTTKGKVVVGIGSLIGVGAAISYFLWIKKRGIDDNPIPPKKDSSLDASAQEEAAKKRDMEKQRIEEEQQRKILAAEKLNELYAKEEVSKSTNFAIIEKYRVAYEAYTRGIFTVTINIVDEALKDIKELRTAQTVKKYEQDQEILKSLQNHMVGNSLQWNYSTIVIGKAETAHTLTLDVHGVALSDVEDLQTTLNKWEEYKTYGYKKVIFTFPKK